MSEFDVTLCKFYDNEICFNEECPVKYCDGYQCIYKERYLLREHCKFIDKTNKILNKQKESLLKENEELKEYIDKAGIVEIIKVLKCLDEIKGIIKNSLDACHVCNSSSSCMNCDKGEMLQKIKEVKGDE